MRALTLAFLTIACIASITDSVRAGPASYTRLANGGSDLCNESSPGEPALPVDPVVEEPIRPLYPEDPGPPVIEAVDCGPLDILVLPVSLLLVATLRAVPSRCRG